MDKTKIRSACVAAVLGGIALWYSSSDYQLTTAWELAAAEQVVPETVAGKQVEVTFRLRNVSSRSLRICGTNFC